VSAMLAEGAPCALNCCRISILPLPHNRIAASCGTGWVTIAADGRIDPRDAWPANTPLTLAGRCILLGSYGRWRPLK
jgi:hypothetical protein